MQQDRQTAYKTDIGSLLSGKYIVNEGWEPNHILCNGRKISRANIIAGVVDKTNGSVVLDDGSGKITARAFDENIFFDKANVGDMVVFVGRPREFNGQIFLVIEIIKKINDKKWAEVRKKELENIFKSAPKIEYELENKKDERSKTEEKNEHAKEIVGKKDEYDNSTSESIIKIIKSLDSGNGVDIEDIISKSKKSDAKSDAEAIINRLLMRGDIFEIKPGRVKVLE